MKIGTMTEQNKYLLQSHRAQAIRQGKLPAKTVEVEDRSGLYLLLLQ